MKHRFVSGSVALVLLLASSFALAQADWTQRTPTTSPSARTQPAMANFGSQVALFGGDAAGTFLGDTWIWDGTTWTQLTRFGLFGTLTPPPPRTNASMAYFPDTGQVILFGGLSPNGTLLNDTWSLDFETNVLVHRSAYNWAQITTPVSPPVRENASMTYDPISKKIILTAGTNGGSSLNDTWEFDPGVHTGSSQIPASWKQITAAPFAPKRQLSGFAQCGDSALDTPSQFLLFGGSIGGGGLLNPALFDSWVLTDSAGMFAWTQPFSGGHPAARLSHGMAYYPVSNRVLLYGGADGTVPGNLFSDTWNGLCGTTPSWTQATPIHNPGPRELMGMATGPNGNTVVLFGGVKKTASGGFQASNETWTWGRRAACLPTDGSELEDGDEVNCEFDRIPGIRFGEWDASGFGPRFSDRQKVSFKARGRGPAAITAYWSDANGSQNQTYSYTVTARRHHHKDE